MIREGKTAQIYGAIQTGGRLSMQTLEMALGDLYKKKIISFEAAMAKTFSSGRSFTEAHVGGPPSGVKACG